MMANNKTSTTQELRRNAVAALLMLAVVMLATVWMIGL